MKHEIDMFGAGDICALGPAKPPAPDPLPSLTRCPIEITDEVTEFDPNSGKPSPATSSSNQSRRPRDVALVSDCRSPAGLWSGSRPIVLVGLGRGRRCDVEPRHEKHTFEEVRAGGMRLPLPPRNRKGKWTEQPQAFQPFDESWPHALPDPLASTPEAHFAPTVVDAPIEKHARHWWFDPMQIVYETAPKISRRMVEGRVMRAWRCILLTKLDARDRVVDTSNAAVIAKMIHMAKSSGEIMAEFRRRHRVRP